MFRNLYITVSKSLRNNQSFLKNNLLDDVYHVKLKVMIKKKKKKKDRIVNEKENSDGVRLSYSAFIVFAMPLSHNEITEE